jgi:hypothetical protein
LDKWILQTHFTLKTIQKIFGKLRFAAEVIPAAKVHLLPLQNLMSKLTRLQHKHAKVPPLVTTIFRWFHETLSLPAFSGIHLLVRKQERAKISGATSDAAFKGEGFYWQNKYFYREWPKDILDLAKRSKTTSITFLEAFTTVDFVATFAEPWRGKDVTLECDNQPWCFAHTNEKTRCPYLTVLLLCLTKICALHDITLRIIHIKGVLNIHADLLSRLQVQKFLLLNPTAVKVTLVSWQNLACWP